MFGYAMNYVNIPGVVFSSLPIKDNFFQNNNGYWVVTCNVAVGLSDLIGKSCGGRGIFRQPSFRILHFIIMLICNAW